MPFAAAHLRGSLADPRAVVARAAQAARVHGSEIQLLRPEAAASERHLRAAALHAERAFAEDRARTQTLALEVLCFLAGERQITHAIARAGLAPHATEAIAVALGGEPRLAVEAVARELGCEVRWDLPERRSDVAEREALERTALLDLER